MNLTFLNYTTLTPDQHKELLFIRNLDYVRINMLDDSVIDINDHLQWVEKLKNDSTRKYYAILLDNELIGGINITNIDMNNKTSYWGIFMKKNSNPMVPSLSTYIIIDKIFNELKLEILNLEVNINNINAYKFDKNFGFQDVDEYTKGESKYYLMKMHKDDWEQHKITPLLKIIKQKLDTVTIKFKD